MVCTGSWQSAMLSVAIAMCALVLCLADLHSQQEVPRKRIFCNPIGCMTNKRGEDSAQPPLLWPPAFGQSKRSMDRAATREYRKLLASLAASLPEPLQYSPSAVASPIENNLQKSDLLQLLLAAHRRGLSQPGGRTNRQAFSFDVPADFAFNGPEQPLE